MRVVASLTHCALVDSREGLHGLARSLPDVGCLDLPGGSLRPPIQRVIAELKGVYDDLELAIWFAQPNSWLAGASPVQVLGNDVPAVLGAARADRFVATG